jgi:2-isopropylmalate synthase
MQVDFSKRVQLLADETKRELTAGDIWAEFVRAYRLDDTGGFTLVDYEGGFRRGSGSERIFTGRIRHRDREIAVTGRGNGLVSAVLAAIAEAFGIDLSVVDYQEHALRRGTDAKAAAYLQCVRPDGMQVFGVGIDDDVATATVKAVLSAASAVG